MSVETTVSYIMYTVEPPNKGHVGDNINLAVLSFSIERLFSFRGSKCTKTIGHIIFGTSNSVLCREVYYTVSLFWRVHYQRFHCIHFTGHSHQCVYYIIAQALNSGGIRAENLPP